MAKTISMSIKGDRELIRVLNRLGNNAAPALGKVLYKEAEDILGDSKEHFVPVDLAVLKNSGHVELPDISRNWVKVTLGFGGAASEYALIQHEAMDFHHTVGQAKYLETPVLGHAKSMPHRLATSLRGYFQSKGR